MPRGHYPQWCEEHWQAGPVRRRHVRLGGVKVVILKLSKVGRKMLVLKFGSCHVGVHHVYSNPIAVASLLMQVQFASYGLILHKTLCSMLDSQASINSCSSVLDLTSNRSEYSKVVSESETEAESESESVQSSSNDAFTTHCNGSLGSEHTRVCSESDKDDELESELVQSKYSMAFTTGSLCSRHCTALRTPFLLVGCDQIQSGTFSICISLHFFIVVNCQSVM